MSDRLEWHCEECKKKLIVPVRMFEFDDDILCKQCLSKKI